MILTSSLKTRKLTSLEAKQPAVASNKGAAEANLIVFLSFFLSFNVNNKRSYGVVRILFWSGFRVSSLLDQSQEQYIIANSDNYVPMKSARNSVHLICQDSRSTLKIIVK